jgi:hypothetical protein
VLWCAELRSRKGLAPKYYDPWTAAVYDAKPIGTRRGLVLAVTENRGVLVYVTTYGEDPADGTEDNWGRDGIYKRKHWVPLRRIWTKTGEWQRPPNPNKLAWAEPDQEWREARRE